MYLTENIRPYLKAATITAKAGELVRVLSQQGEVCLCQSQLGAKFSVHSSKLSQIPPVLTPEIPLSDMQRHIIDFMRNNSGSFLRPIKSVSGGKCYRLLDVKINPIMNVSTTDADYLYASGLLKRGENNIYEL